LRRALAVAAVTVCACWDFDTAVDKCKADPTLCLPDMTGEAAFGDKACADGVDNDMDGKTDCADSDCNGITCRTKSDACDVPEVCTNGACPADALASPGTVCRGQAGICDVIEYCTGNDAGCPPDALVERDTVCGVAPDGGCEQSSSCDGVSSTCPSRNIAPAGTVCRRVAGACDVEEVCDGMKRDCPPDIVKDATVICRYADGGCDLDDYCSGTSGLCGHDDVKTKNALCRSPVGACDTPERCDGMSPMCPPDVSSCDAGLFCDGMTDSCLPKLDAGVMCTTDMQCLSGHCANGVCCDQACSGGCGVCNLSGQLGTCSPKAMSFACRVSTGACDPPEVCTGSSLDCPADVFANASTVCRAAAGGCDVAEKCDGVSAQCPSDVVAPSTMVCRPLAGACDLPESCDGINGACPADRFIDAGVQCRPAMGGPCDAPESCTGASPTCPPDGLFPGGTQCGSPSCGIGELFPAPRCDDAGSCNTGAPTSCNGYQCVGTACLTSCTVTGQCDGTHQCDGGQCLSLPGLGTPCTMDIQCSSGHCSDNVCCNVDCSGACKVCTSSGLCTNRAGGTDVEGGCSGYTCDGNGSCHTSCAGQPPGSNYCNLPSHYCSDAGVCSPPKASGPNRCASTYECASSNCTDGYCCNSPCNGVCESCALVPGTCTPHDAGSDPETGCGNYVCNGASACTSSCSGVCSTSCKASAYCDGTSHCVPDLAPNSACTSTCQCPSCIADYQDTDNDGYGNPDAGAMFCGTPSGWSANNSDCCDTEPLAHPGQTNFYAMARTGCGGYDYDCDSTETEADLVVKACKTTIALGGTVCTCSYDGIGPFTPGWSLGVAPGCGASATYITACTDTPMCTCGDICTVNSSMMKTQACR
jgi:hypothetical protein